MIFSTVNDIDNSRKKYNHFLSLQRKKVLICAGTGCVAGGALIIYDRIKKLIEQKGILVDIELEEEKEGIGIKKSGCHGFCEMGPLLRIEPDGYFYIKVKPDDCEEIVEKTLIEGKSIERLMYKDDNGVFPSEDSIPFYKKQTRKALENCGKIHSESIKEYIANDGYSAFQKAIIDLTPKEICEMISDAKLRGRGGGGFLTGIKWTQVLKQDSPEKYVVCNGDEGDPGAFMDRSIMEGDPHRIIEGMLIAGYATKSTEGYIYVRAEYPLAVDRLKKAIEKAKEYGLLGENILGSGFNFDIHVNQGAGAFVCGEGSALTASIEGNRGMPRVKPPRTVEKGLWEKPTVLNNVETLANVPLILLNGVDWYRSIGTENSPGTKAFALTGNVKNTGLIEVPMGTTLREIIYDIGGGIKDNKKFKAVQVGGPSGACVCLPKKHLDLPMDFDSLKNVGAMIGSGGLVVMDEDTCMVEVARFFMNFTQNESCGKCVPCREGTKRMLEILDKIVSGKGELEDIDLLYDLADTVSNTALCGLGKTAANPVISTLNYFKDEYIAHIVDKRCPTKSCEKLKVFEINKNMCKGCSKCVRVCPVNAIEGKVREVFKIDKEKCIKCGACVETCPFSAIEEV